jgi:hypothetical protein
MEVFGLPWGVDDACTAASLQAFGSIIAMRSWCLVLMMIAVPHHGTSVWRVVLLTVR